MLNYILKCVLFILLENRHIDKFAFGFDELDINIQLFLIVSKGWFYCFGSKDKGWYMEIDKQLRIALKGNNIKMYQLVAFLFC